MTPVAIKTPPAIHHSQPDSHSPHRKFPFCAEQKANREQELSIKSARNKSESSERMFPVLFQLKAILNHVN